jgi:hypothetical protein
MIDLFLGLIGLGLAGISPVLPRVFPGINRIWVSRGFVLGLMMIGGALGTILYPAKEIRPP